jgi:hypothetical protein
MREAWFSHNGTMPLFLLFIVGIFLFRQFIILLEQICHAFALRHLCGEGIGLHHGLSVLAMRLKEFLRIQDTEVIESTLFLRNNQEKTTFFL